MPTLKVWEDGLYAEPDDLNYHRPGPHLLVHTDAVLEEEMDRVAQQIVLNNYNNTAGEIRWQLLPENSSMT